MLVGGEGLALASRGWQAARVGDYREAERLFDGAVRADPHLYDAWGALIRVRGQLGMLGQAQAALDQARAAGMPLASLRAHEAFIAALEGETAAARQALAEIPGSAAANDAVIADLVRVTREVLARARR